MNTTIYYFSGTGNSYAVARDITLRIDAKLIAIREIINLDEIHIETDSIGIVFPSYIAPIVGFPMIIERFLHKISNIGSIHIFAICTCGGYESVNALPSLVRLRNTINDLGGKLSEEYSVRLPMNNLDYDHIPVPIDKNQQSIIRKADIKIGDISNSITMGKGTKYRLVKNLFFQLMSPLYAWMREPILKDLRNKAMEPMNSKMTYRELMASSDKSIVVNANCMGCGFCAKICPVGNIIIINQKPEFQHRCEVCFACDEWCPQMAIQHWSRGKGIKYHHPRVETPNY